MKLRWRCSSGNIASMPKGCNLDMLTLGCSDNTQRSRSQLGIKLSHGNISLDFETLQRTYTYAQSIINFWTASENNIPTNNSSCVPEYRCRLHVNPMQMTTNAMLNDRFAISPCKRHQSSPRSGNECIIHSTLFTSHYTVFSFLFFSRSFEFVID